MRRQFVEVAGVVLAESAKSAADGGVVDAHDGARNLVKRSL